MGITGHWGTRGMLGDTGGPWGTQGDRKRDIEGHGGILEDTDLRGHGGTQGGDRTLGTLVDRWGGNGGHGGTRWRGHRDVAHGDTRDTNTERALGDTQGQAGREGQTWGQMGTQGGHMGTPRKEQGSQGDTATQGGHEDTQGRVRTRGHTG